jgi:hypothetical protein
MFLFDEREFKIFRSFRVISLDPVFGDLSIAARGLSCCRDWCGGVGITQDVLLSKRAASSIPVMHTTSTLLRNVGKLPTVRQI